VCRVREGDGGRRGLIPPGLWYKLVLERRKRYSGEKGSPTIRPPLLTPVHPSYSLHIHLLWDSAFEPVKT